MKLEMNINYEVREAETEIEDFLSDVVAEEARDFVRNVERRLAAEGVTDIRITTEES